MNLWRRWLETARRPRFDAGDYYIIQVQHYPLPDGAVVAHTGRIYSERGEELNAFAARIAPACPPGGSIDIWYAHGISPMPACTVRRPNHPDGWRASVGP